MTLIIASMLIGRSTSFAPDAYKAKLAANNIFNLLDRKPLIEICDGEAECPVSIYIYLCYAIVLIFIPTQRACLNINIMNTCYVLFK